MFSKVPKQYREYEDTKELVNDWKARFGTLPVIRIRNKTDKECYNVRIILRYCVQAINETNNGCFSSLVLSMTNLLFDFEFLDGTPCGVKVA